MWGLAGSFRHVDLVARAQPIHRLPRTKVAVLGIPASAGGDCMGDIDSTASRVLNGALEGSHVEILETAVLGDPKPGADAFTTRAAGQFGDFEIFSLTFDAVMHDRENYEIFWVDFRNITFVSDGQGAPTCVLATVSMDVVVIVQCVAFAVGGVTPL